MKKPMIKVHYPKTEESKTYAMSELLDGKIQDIPEATRAFVGSINGSKVKGLYLVTYDSIVDLSEPMKT